jgi:hypothetical protein
MPPEAARLAPAWATATAFPATVTVALRPWPVALAATDTVTQPESVPLPGDTVAQPAFDAALHEQPAVVVTVTTCELPVLGAETLVGETE